MASFKRAVLLFFKTPMEKMENKMTSRERVLAAINHKEPDRVPIDLGATPSSGISAIAHARLIETLGWDDKNTYL